MARPNGGYTREPVSPYLRRAILERDDYTCCYCGATRQDGMLQIDHVIPISQGGQTTFENLVTACRSCNFQKGDRALDEWSEHIRARYGKSLLKFLLHKANHRSKRKEAQRLKALRLTTKPSSEAYGL